MGQFKPMVKMETTEPTVELKLKKGGYVNMKKGGKVGNKKMAMGGGAMDMMMGTPALVGRPAINAPVRAPGKPSMASRRRAMMAKKPAMPSAPAMGMPPMKKGGKAEGGESKGMHKAEMKAIKGVDSKLTKHASMAASKGHKGLKTGGVALGNAGGFKTGGVALGNAGGFKTGGVTMSNAGGYKAGGKTSKKAYATGGTVNSGKPVAMAQGAKKPSSPVSINQLSGTFKKGGQANRMKDGGDPQADKETKGYKDFYINQKADNLADAEAMNPMTYIRPLVKKVKSMFGSGDAPGAVTKTKESTTIVPKKQRKGGEINC